MNTGRLMRVGAATASAGLVLTAAALAGPAAASISSSEPYAPGGDFVTYCVAALNLDLGGGCFTPAPGATSVQASIADAVSTRTAGEIQFKDASGNTLGSSVGFCGQSPQVAIPAGAASVFVVTDGPLLANLAESCGPTSFGTVGTVTLTQSFPPPQATTTGTSTAPAKSATAQKSTTAQRRSTRRTRHRTHSRTRAR